MPKSTPPPDDPKQLERFLDMAREVDADPDQTAFEAAFFKVAAAKPDKKAARSL